MKKIINTLIIAFFCITIQTQLKAQTTTAVGTIPGQVSVSHGGGATYNIPIECPAGIMGMQPNLSLSYNSQGGDGAYGVGWNLNGLSVIRKTIKNIFSDGAISGVEDNNSNAYTLDGQRLFVKNLVSTNSSYSGSNQSDEDFVFVELLAGSTYETQNKDYSKIETFGIAGYLSEGEPTQPWSITNKGPRYFKVTSKDGYIREYTVTANIYSQEDSHPLTWYLNKVTDPNGNYMVYNYQTDEGQTILKSIDYTGNGNATPFCSIVFDYVNRMTFNTYVGSTQIANKYLLSDIQIKNGNTLLKQYSFSYINRKFNYYLSSVSLTGQNNTNLNNTTFQWGADNTVIGVNKISVPQPYQSQSVSSSDKHWLSADLDGDGLTDIINIYPVTTVVNGVSQTKNYLQTFKASQTNGQVSFANDAYFELDDNFSYNDIKSLNPSICFANLYGDTKNEIIIPQLIQSGGNTIKFNILGAGSVQQTLQASSEIPAYALGDINNDGKEEIIYIEKGKVNNSYYPGKIGYNVNGQTVWEDKQFVLNEAPTSLIISDFNADGLKDIMILMPTNHQIYKNLGGTLQANGILSPTFVNQVTTNPSVNSSCKVIKMGDFNGDGLPDFIINESNSSIFYLAINDGKGGFSMEESGITTSPSDDNSILHNKQKDCIVTDFNHDGKSDIILSDVIYNYYPDLVLAEDDIYSHYIYDKTKITWYESFGAGFISNKEINFTDGNNIYNKDFNTLGDFNGDGREDVLTYGSDIVNGNDKSDNLYLHNSFNTNFEGNLLTSVTNGLGKTTQVAYQQLIYPTTADNKPFYTKGSSSVYPMVDLTVPLYCVRKISEPDGQGGLLTTEFSYTEARAQQTGAGYLGFKTQTITNAASNKKIVSTTDLNTGTYLPEKMTQYVSTLTDSPISKTETFITNTVTGNIYESLQNKTIRTDYLTGLSQTTEYLSYDGYGNPTSIKTTQGNIVSTQALTYVQKGSWCPNKPDAITVTKTKNGESYTRVVNYAYDDKGNLTSEIVDPGNINQQSTVYSLFNAFGQPTKAETTANGNTRTVTITPTPSGRFIQSKTNPLGETTTYDWDETKAVLKSEATRLGITLYTYNGLGQLTLIQYPNGMQKYTTAQWASEGNEYNGKFYICSATSGYAGVCTWYDALGREIAKETNGLNGQTIRAFTEYYPDGKLYRISEPTFGSSADKWATTYNQYDGYGRPVTVTTPDGQTTMAYSGTTTTVTSPNGTKQTVLNTEGQVQTSTVNGKTITYDYYPSGLAKTATPVGGQAISMQYDLQGNRTKLIDPDAGTIRNVYNGFGELILEKQLMKAGQDSVSTVNMYDETTGLLQTIVRGTETTSYGYDDVKRLSTIEIAGQHKQTFTYGSYDRVTNVKEEIGGQVYNKQVGYDDYGRVNKEIFPSGYTIFNTYDDYGNLVEVTDANHSIWKAVEANARGQLTKVDKGIKQTVYGYDDRGMTTSIQAAGIVDLSYVFDSKGNLFSRTDALTNQKEQFGYDALNRLTNWDIHQNSTNALLKANSITYDATTGNITGKSDLGNFTLSYGGKRPDGSDIGPHALATISGVPTGTPTDNLNATYTNFRKIQTLTEGNPKYYNVTYGVDQQRRKSVQIINGVTTTRYYLGDYEEQIVGNIVRKIHYLSGGNGMAAIYVQNINNNTTQDSLMYAYTDNQGSLIALTKENGDTLQTYAYDPWGARRNPRNWAVKDSRTSWIVNRGYTMHEHIDAFGIINMNGRVYDPQTAMFMNTDPLVQSPDNWVNYNRYTYCFNNPLIYTDPSGYANSATGEQFWEIMRDGGSYFDAYSSTCLSQGNTVLNNNGWGGSSGSGGTTQGHWEEISNTSMIQVTYNVNSKGEKYNYCYTYQTEFTRQWIPGSREDRMYDIMHNGFVNQNYGANNTSADRPNNVLGNTLSTASTLGSFSQLACQGSEFAFATNIKVTGPLLGFSILSTAYSWSQINPESSTEDWVNASVSTIGTIASAVIVVGSIITLSPAIITSATIVSAGVTIYGLAVWSVNLYNLNNTKK